MSRAACDIVPGPRCPQCPLEAAAICWQDPILLRSRVRPLRRGSLCHPLSLWGGMTSCTAPRPTPQGAPGAGHQNGSTGAEISLWFSPPGRISHLAVVTAPCPLLLVTPSPFPRPRGLPASTKDILGIAARSWSITGCRAPSPMDAEHHSSSFLDQMAPVPHTEFIRGTEPQLSPLNSSLQSKTNTQCIFCTPHAKAHTCTRKAVRCWDCQSHAPPREHCRHSMLILVWFPNKPGACTTLLTSAFAHPTLCDFIPTFTEPFPLRILPLSASSSALTRHQRLPCLSACSTLHLHPHPVATQFPSRIPQPLDTTAHRDAVRPDPSQSVWLCPLAASHPPHRCFAPVTR